MYPSIRKRGSEAQHYIYSATQGSRQLAEDLADESVHKDPSAWTATAQCADLSQGGVPQAQRDCRGQPTQALPHTYRKVT